jgi:hypothetical protein
LWRRRVRSKADPKFPRLRFLPGVLLSSLGPDSELPATPSDLYFAYCRIENSPTNLPFRNPLRC